MLIDFFYTLKKAGLPVTVKELLTLLEALEKQVVFGSIDDFYVLSRLCMVKDEQHFDRFDQAFGHYFHNLEMVQGLEEFLIPHDWLDPEWINNLSEEEKAQIEALGGLDKLMETLKKRLQEQQGKHQGGNKWIGTGGTSPFGHGGYNPEGVRIGGPGRHQRAVKVWEKRQFRNLSDDVEIGTRSIKMALRHLRHFARTGAADELDLDDTIRSTAKNAGLLDLKMRPEKHNAVKLLMFFDVGGSMDYHIEQVEQLFSAARSEFKHLEYYYFHNCVYEHLWRDNSRRWDEPLNTYDVLNTYGSDYRVIFVGDAAMSPYELTHAGGSVEHMNQEVGLVWLQRLLDQWPNHAWLNPIQQAYWDYTHSTQILKKVLDERMFPMTLSGIEAMAKSLSA
ncbi:MAG: vWA domain-containing protein [Marinicella pacifica]